MSAAIEKFGLLCDALWAKTSENKVPWRTEGNLIAFDSGPNVCLIKRSSNSNGDDIYTVSLLNGSGVVLESFDNETLVDIAPSSNFENYFQLLDALFERGRRQATGADVALDDLLHRLESETLDIPF